MEDRDQVDQMDQADQAAQADESRERRMALLLAVVLVALLAAAATLWWRQRADDDPTAAVLHRAQTAATTFFTLDHATIERDLDAMAELSTGDFADDYAEEREKLADQVKRKQLSVTATVVERGTAVEYLHEDDAQVLVAIDATTSDSAGAAETSHYRIRVMLDRVDDGWLVAGLEQVG